MAGKGRPKKTDTSKVDLSELADVAELRTQAEGGLQQINALGPEHTGALEPLIAQLNGAREALDARRTAAITKATGAVESQIRPVLDLYDACVRSICAKLGRPAPAAPAEGPEYTFEIVDETAIPAAFRTAFDHKLANAYCIHKGGQCEIPGIKITKRGT